jgi:hypothetical protein
LQGTITDVLVRMQTHDGVVSTALVRPSRPNLDIVATPGAATVATAYLVHGIEHILLGYDHLLFVLALILIVPRLRVLITTVTAFTLAHSITLAWQRSVSCTPATDERHCTQYSSAGF